MDTTESGVKGKKWVKWVACSFFGIALALFAFVWLGTHVDDFLAWRADRADRAFEALLRADQEKLKAMEMSDTYGSTTPEGTTMLIIAALESGDVQLASKYYYVLDQEKALASFKKQQAEKGNLDIAITFFKDILKGKKECNEKGDGCTLEYTYIRQHDEAIEFPGAPEPMIFKKGSEARESNNFDLNRYTGFWKAAER